MLLVLYIFIKYILEPRQISKMEISAKRTKDLQSLFAFAKNSIPEVSHVPSSGPPAIRLARKYTATVLQRHYALCYVLLFSKI